ncbi:organic solute transporter subunit alpha [Aureococcus anophagefferens]|uniref:Organic solute transporter subunit alpha n=1 Tax=Aureococcus anophagefferens TaxID=44056 RepID=A0ABR1G423_AURAN
MDDDASGDTTNPLNVESNLTEPLTGADEVVLDGRTRGPSVDDDALYAVLSRRRAVGLMVTPGRAYLLPVSATFAGAAVPVALYGVYTHANNYWRPVLQVYATRILWMVPVYAVCSLAELVLWLEVEQGCGECRRWTAVPGALRDCYESYTVLNFFYFMVTFLEVHYGGAAEKVLREGITKNSSADDDDDDEDLAARTRVPPVRWFCSPWRLDSPEFLGQCRYGSRRVKGLVFGTFFQDLGIDAVFYCSPGLATKFGATQDDATAALGALKCTLMCVEMLAFALLHAHAFPASQYPRVRLESPEDAENPSTSWLAAWGDYYAQQKRERRRRARACPGPTTASRPRRRSSTSRTCAATPRRRRAASRRRRSASSRNARSAPALAQFNRLSLGRMTAQAAQRAAGSPRAV